ncbi:hypothetical protein [Vibrio profundi]|uniref:hypothetical protein n=1 Tax=Vibrio profundi TaxID=1774960 RepID=UPI003734E5D3
MKKLVLAAALIAASFTASAVDMTEHDVKTLNQALSQLSGTMADELTRNDSAVMMLVDTTLTTTYQQTLLAPFGDLTPMNSMNVIYAPTANLVCNNITAQLNAQNVTNIEHVTLRYILSDSNAFIREYTHRCEM